MLQPLRLLLVDNYDSFTYNLYQAFLILNCRVEVCRNNEKRLKKAFIRQFEAIVISPGPGRPDDGGFSKQIIADFQGRIPILGVCLGMQCINEVHGGRTIHAPVPVHGKVSVINHCNSDIYKKVPSPFEAARYHSLVIDPAPSLQITAQTADKIPMSLKVPDLPVWGVQYHPESFLTPHGPRILANFLKQCRKWKNAPSPQSSPAWGEED